MEKRELRREKRIKKLDEKWLSKYGVTYTNVVLKSNANKKKRKIKHPFLNILKYAKGEGWLIAFTLIFYILSLVCVLSLPIIMNSMLNEISDANWKYALFLAGLFVILRASDYFTWLTQNYLSKRLVTKVSKKVSDAMFKNMVNAKQVNYTQIGSGEMVNKVVATPERFLNVLIYLLNDIYNTLSSFVIVLYIATIDLRLTAIFLSGGLLYVIIDLFYARYWLEKNNRRSRVTYDCVYNNVIESVRGSVDVKALNIKKTTQGKISNLFKLYNNSSFNQYNADLVEKIVGNVLWFSSYFAGFICGILFMANGSLSVASFLLIIMYRDDLMNFFYNATTIIGKVSVLKVDATRMNEVLDPNILTQESFGTKHIDDMHGYIEFKNVCFKYKDENDYVLKDLSIKINAGQKIAFVGQSGQGKSTIMNLIPKFYSANSGEILIDGVNVEELDEDTLRGNLSLVSQSPYIFNDTIRNNLKIAKEDATEEEMIEACKKAEIYDFIKSKETGFDTILGEGSIILSGGQKQRIAIARALLRDSKILLLDEATSALDNATQENIKTAIDNLDNRTVIIVAHRLSTVVDCDRILFLQNGKIIADGKHEELLKTCDEYKKLYALEEKNKNNLQNTETQE